MTILLFSLIDDDGWRAWYVFSENVFGLNPKNDYKVYRPFDDYTTRGSEGFKFTDLGKPIDLSALYTPRKPRRVDELINPHKTTSATLLSPRISKGYFRMELEIHLDITERLQLHMKSYENEELPASREDGLLFRPKEALRLGGTDNDSVRFWHYMVPY